MKSLSYMLLKSRKSMRIILPNKKNRQRRRPKWKMNLIIWKEVNIEYCPSNDMLADYHTKPLIGEKFKNLRDKIINIAWTAGVCWRMVKNIIYIHTYRLYVKYLLRIVISHNKIKNLNWNEKSCKPNQTINHNQLLDSPLLLQ